MIDFIKINNLRIGSEIQKLMDFEIKVNQETGEELMNKKKSAYLKNMIFTLTPGERFAKVGGSLHKFYNNGKVNNDRFTFDKFHKVYENLCAYISPDDLINVALLIGFSGSFCVSFATLMAKAFVRSFISSTVIKYGFLNR